MTFTDPDEEYIYEERLGILGVIGRPPTEEEWIMAMEDVERFRQELNELLL